MRAGRVIPLSNYSVQGVTVQTTDNTTRMSCTAHKQAQEIENLTVQAVHVPSVHRDKLVVQENNTCVQNTTTVHRHEAPVHQESVDVHQNNTTAHQDKYTVHAVVPEDLKEDQLLIEASKNESSLV